MYFIYILYSEKKDKYYVGHTNNLTLRLKRHNSGRNKSTKSGVPWEMVYFEEYETKSEAMKRENKIKKQKSKKYITELLNKS
ncbi:MAG: GIY-YIG nuclease family protein [Candidatus Cloacimonetes bacterium]|nr:GIY-YIG nuclease family protein [Candidatus Cloacimonadota bacterium]